MNIDISSSINVGEHSLWFVFCGTQSITAFISIVTKWQFQVQKLMICLLWIPIIHTHWLNWVMIFLGNLHEWFDAWHEWFYQRKMVLKSIVMPDTNAHWPQVDKFKCQPIHWLVLKQLTLDLEFLWKCYSLMTLWPEIMSENCIDYGTSNC